MNLDTTYLVTANVVTTTNDGWMVSHQVPAFMVTAISEANAETIARDIINPTRTAMTIHTVAQRMADIVLAP